MEMLPGVSMEVGAEAIENTVTGGEAIPHTVPPTPAHTTFIFNIEGMETTQATQFYKSLRTLHAPHAEADNAVPLIERKHLAIRIYPNLIKPWW